MPASTNPIHTTTVPAVEKAAAATPNHRLSTNDVRAETRSSTTEASATSKPTHIHTRSLLLMMRVTGTSPHEKNE